MRAMRNVLWAAVFVLACGVGEARADLIVLGAEGGAPIGVMLDNLNWLPLGSGGGISGILTVSFEGNAQAVTGSVASQYATPYVSGLNSLGFGNSPDGLDETVYITSGYGSGASAILSFSSPQQYFGMLWGSIDTYNTLSFYDGNNLVGSLTGTEVKSNASGGFGPDGTWYVNIDSTLPFNRVVATSTSPALEFDNVAYSATPVPEPSSLLLLGVGLTTASLKFRRRRD